MICKSFITSINVRISKFMLLLILLQASGAGEGEVEVAGVGKGAEGAVEICLGAEPVERGAG